MFTNSQEQSVVAQRPPSSAHLLVSSVDRYNDSFDRLLNPKTSANWIMNKPYNLLYGYFTRLALTQLQFQWNLPTIIEGVNDQFDIFLDDILIQTTIAPGWYTLSELAEEIQDGIRAADGYLLGWNFTVTVVNGSLVMQATVPMTIGVGQPGAEQQQVNKFMITAGLYVSESTVVGGLQTIVNGVAPMVYTKFIDICSQRLTQFQRVKDATTLVGNPNSDVIARVYPCPPNVLLNNSQSGQLFAEPWVMTIDYNTPKHIRWSPDQAINNFDIQFKDEFGQIITWNTRYPTEYQMTFLASET